MNKERKEEDILISKTKLIRDYNEKEPQDVNDPPKWKYTQEVKFNSRKQVVELINLENGFNKGEINFKKKPKGDV